ncbi:hypothetical protein [Aeromonas hydrophila]|uniref:hypothetical protein n=1 Tax=Aeromonas hydrophila TaxID=644 RepID=UPI0011192A13|nr:hypothetical protein [Aeromonas hydrophila]ELA9382443.1 hypothetical protein [Aeromonas hydrophila]
MLALTTPLLLAFAASEALARKANGSSPQPASTPDNKQTSPADRAPGRCDAKGATEPPSS